MSTFALPHSLSRRARSVLFASFTCIDDSGNVALEGKPPSALATLQRLLGVSRPNIWGAITELSVAGLVVRTYVKTDNTMRVRIHLHALNVEGACESCGSPSKGTGKWCAYCKQVLGRDDRSWQLRALELHLAGVSPPRIAVILRRPLWTRARETGEDSSHGGVVPYLVAQGVLDESWAKRLSDAARSHVDD